MALQRVKLADIQYLPTTAGSLYANGSGQTTLLAGVILFNNNTTTETVKLYVVPDSSTAVGTAAASNQIAELTLASKDTVFLEFPFAVVLTDQNDTLQGSTTTGSMVTVIVVGDRNA